MILRSLHLGIVNDACNSMKTMGVLISYTNFSLCLLKSPQSENRKTRGKVPGDVGGLL